VRLLQGAPSAALAKTGVKKAADILAANAYVVYFTAGSYSFSFLKK